ncbi:hypothetical protein C1882_04905 [Pseudomonas sp. FW305-E2]|nr:hypothetical protein C1882_04905 [Pseudomonas sp. FW305-E2]
MLTGAEACGVPAGADMPAKGDRHKRHKAHLVSLATWRHTIPHENPRTQLPQAPVPDRHAAHGRSELRPDPHVYRRAQ